MNQLTVSDDTGLTQVDLDALCAYRWPFNVSLARHDDPSCIEFKVVDGLYTNRIAMELDIFRLALPEEVAARVVVAVERNRNKRAALSAAAST